MFNKLKCGQGRSVHCYQINNPMTVCICTHLGHYKDFPDGSDGKESACNAGDPANCDLEMRQGWCLKRPNNQHTVHTDQSEALLAISNRNGLVREHWQDAGPGGGPAQAVALPRPPEASVLCWAEPCLVTASPAQTLSEDHKAQSGFIL